MPMISLQNTIYANPRVLFTSCLQTWPDKEREARLRFYQLRNAVQQIPTLQGDSQHIPTASNSYHKITAGFPVNSKRAQHSRWSWRGSLRSPGGARFARRSRAVLSFTELHWASLSFIQPHWESLSFAELHFVHCIELYWAVLSWNELY